MVALPLRSMFAFFLSNLKDFSMNNKKKEIFRYFQYSFFTYEVVQHL